ncbi:hypothetical protein N0V90_005647 [Kalmusia sp. IMI 367209]|nr:hypothetical protein N0V90_005647 [Kalmusia sp. IMI 367209]
MGGHAFKRLHCPRISTELYLQMRKQTTDVIRGLFERVIVPIEMPSKTDYGDIDFLVSGFLKTAPGADLDWDLMVAEVKQALQSYSSLEVHGKRGFLNPDVIYFAAQAPGKDFWVQIDVQVCDIQSQPNFEWKMFQLYYASGLKMIGSLIKPLGLTIDPVGLHIRVEEIETTNFSGSLVFVSNEPAHVLKVLGLDKRFLLGGFGSKEELYEYFTTTWVFNPAHFARRLEEGKYRDHIEERSAPWVHFITEWIPEHYPGYRMSGQDISLDEWRKLMRVAMREKVFTLFPSITPEYYTKRGTYLKHVEEHRLQQLLKSAIPNGRDGWNSDISKPPTRVQSASPVAFPLNPTLSNDSVSVIAFEHPPTPPNTPPSSIKSSDLSDNTATASALGDLLATPLYVHLLPRDPPFPFKANPPPDSMSVDAKLLCLARWSRFDPQTGAPYLLREPREKKFEMCWSDSGASDEILVKWAKEMWWGIWVRQCYVNYVGMWKRRFEKDDVKAEKARKSEIEMNCI